MIRNGLNGSSTLHRIEKIFRDQLNLEVPSAEADLFEMGSLDSLTFVNLLVQLEKTFDVKVSLDDLELDVFRSLANITELIDGRLTGRRAAQGHADMVSLSAARREAV